MFISIEGIEGAGKSTQAVRLKDWLEKEKGSRVVLTREPGGTAVGDQIRDVLLRPDNALQPQTELFLLLASRRELCETVIRPALGRGEVVIADRFGDSSVAYQGYGRGLGPDVVRQLVNMATGGLRPDVTILLDVDPELGLRRCLSVKKSEKKGRRRDRMERESFEFFAKVRAGYLEMAEREPDRFRVVSVTGNEEATFTQVKAAVGKSPHGHPKDNIA
jgi:dTMP kinase